MNLTCRQTTLRHLILVLLLIGITTMANGGEVYQYRDSYGNLVISNHPKSSRSLKLKLPPLVSYAAPISQSDLNTGNRKHNYLNDISIINLKTPHINSDRYPTRKVYTGDRKSFDDYGTPSELTGRSLILHEELAHEKKALAESLTLVNQLKSLKDLNKANNSGKFDTRIATLQDNITAHQENIEILTKILDN